MAIECFLRNPNCLKLRGSSLSLSVSQTGFVTQKSYLHLKDIGL